MWSDYFYTYQFIGGENRKLYSINITFNFQLNNKKLINTLGVTITSTLIPLILTIIFTIIEEREKIKKEEKISFECGFNNIRAIKMTFSTNFIIIIIIFLVFDIEVSIIIPIIINNKIRIIETLIPTIFLIALTAIIVKEWRQGTIDWNN